MLDDLQINPDRIPLYKLIAHVLQIVLSFVAWCLEIAVFRSNKAIVNGQAGWAFAVCFLSIPGWIYLIGAPRFPRTRRFAQPHAMVAVDILYFILWLSAFASQAAYNSGDNCGDGCGMSKAIVALGVFNTLLFGLTTFLSIYTLKYYQFNNRLPGYDRMGGPKGSQNIDPDMAAFSTAPHDEEPYARINNMDPDYEHEGHDYHSEVGGGYGGASTVAGGGGVGSSYVNAGSHVNSSYLGAESSVAGSSGYGGGGSTVHQDNPFDDGYAAGSLRPAASAQSLGTTTGHSGYAPPTVHDEYDEDRPVRFPEADYDRH